MRRRRRGFQTREEELVRQGIEKVVELIEAEAVEESGGGRRYASYEETRQF